LTLGNLFLGVNASLVVTVLAVPVAQSTGLAVVVGVLAWLVWQAAYCCDCSDGQLSRVTSTSSAAGGRLDVLCDIAVQVALVGAVAAVTTATRPETPSWLLGVFAASWMINMVTSVMAKEGTNTSLVLSESAAVRLIKLTRDYGFMITMIGFVIAVNPAWMVFLVYAFTAVNVSFLVASIVQATAASHRSDGT
jgi:phosphatidylglycerophosphate synthase